MIKSICKQFGGRLRQRPADGGLAGGGGVGGGDAACGGGTAGAVGALSPGPKTTDYYKAPHTHHGTHMDHASLGACSGGEAFGWGPPVLGRGHGALDGLLGVLGVTRTKATFFYHPLRLIQNECTIWCIHNL